MEIVITRMEEEGFLGARSLDRTMIQADAGITMDGGKVGEVTVASKYWTCLSIKSDKNKEDLEEKAKSWARRSHHSIWFNTDATDGYDVELNILTSGGDIDAIVEDIIALTNSQAHRITRKCPGFNIPLSHEIVEIAKSSISESGIMPQIIPDEIAAEVCVLNSKGIQCVNIGDGVISEHELDERVLISDLEKNCLIIRKILDEYKHRTTASA